MDYPIFPSELAVPYKSFWDHDDITEQKFRLELSRSPSFAKCFNYRYNLSRAFVDDIKKRTDGEHPNSVVIQVFGEQGLGKTTLAMKIAKRLIDPTFTAKKIFFRVEDLFNYCKNVKPNECLMLDEQVLEFGEGSKRQLKDLQNIEEVTRIKSVHFIFCSPTLRTHLACHYTLKVIQRNAKTRFTKFAFCTGSGRAYLGWGQARIPLDDDNRIYQEYLKPKLEFAQKILERSGSKYDLRDYVDKVKSNPRVRPTHKKGEIKIIIKEMWPTFTIAEINNIATAYYMDFDDIKG